MYAPTPTRRVRRVSVSRLTATAALRMHTPPYPCSPTPLRPRARGRRRPERQLRHPDIPKLIFDRQRGSNGEQYLTSLDFQRTARVGDTRLTVVTAGRPTDFATPVVTASSDFTLLEMQSDGDLVLSSCTFQPGNPGQYTAGTCSPIWSSLTYNNPGAHARMQTDGNLVVYTAGGQALWSPLFGRTY